MMTLIWLLLSLCCAWAAEICCPDLGCFSDTGPFSGLPLPECQESQGITHMLFTRSNINSGQSVTRSNIPNIWDGNKETVFLIHGWVADANTEWMHAAKDAILERDDKNVIIVGWGLGAGRPFYPQSASNTRVVGAETRDIKDILRDSHGSNIQSYCTGHSLGAHTCGHMGQFRSDKGVNRISGLDPAGPLFQNADLKRGLNIDCADEVEAWHTDGKDSVNSLGTFFLSEKAKYDEVKEFKVPPCYIWYKNMGTLRPMGHRDFYPNGADLQPGCPSYMLEIKEINQNYINDTVVGCSHGRATIYFIESAQNDCFAVNQICTDETNLPGSCSSCSDCPNMGYVNGSGQNGKYYFEVNDAQPHCQG